MGKKEDKPIVQLSAPLPVLLSLPFDRKSKEWVSLRTRLKLELAVIGLSGFNKRYGMDFKTVDELDRTLK